jgi:UDP-2,4-diacetamido-2,4,6-trideoxy-beta-L-altropyranose hydrolase
MNKKLAVFRFEASSLIGAGHAIRCSVLINSLISLGWNCVIVTSEKTYEFVKFLNQFKCIDIDSLHARPFQHDLLVVDNYDLDYKYENYFRTHAKKILVIDDLANRKHDCDILLDQTYNRDPKDYKNLVPEHCKILTGNKYTLLRSEFIKLRPRALLKRIATNKIEKILISMGGSELGDYTLQALELINKIKFKGIIDIVLGFTDNNLYKVKQYISSMKNLSKINIFHDINNMAELIYEADLAIGAAGSSVWERCCLGLPSVLLMIASNQKDIYESLIHNKICYSYKDLAENDLYNIRFNTNFYNLIDGFGVNRVLIEALMPDIFTITLKHISPEDKDMLFDWQNIKDIRKYCNNPEIPSYEEHLLWFKKRIKQTYNPFWIIYDSDANAIGVINLVYNSLNDYYDLGWYIIPQKQSEGLGTQALKLATFLVRPMKVHAFVKPENISSHKALQKAGFEMIDHQNYLFNK